MLSKAFLYLKTIVTDLLYQDSYVVLYAKPTKKNSNWGDDIGEKLISFLTSKKLIFYRGAFISRFIRKKKHYLIIGSIIPQFSKPDSIIWGSGVGESNYKLQNKPNKVLAVRGPLTRQYLLDKGVDCPEVYGDPALLFPRFYKSHKRPKYKIGFIPHFIDQDSRFFNFLNDFGNDVKFIDVTNYGEWNDFIDNICECEFIISSSLHGLIIADAYNIPNIWGEFTHVMGDNGFKFRDYLLSVNKKTMKPYKVYSYSHDELKQLKKKYEKASINLEPLLSVCPFK